MKRKDYLQISVEYPVGSGLKVHPSQSKTLVDCSVPPFLAEHPLLFDLKELLCFLKELEFDGHHQKGGQGEVVAQVVVEVEAVEVVLLTLSQTEVEEVVEALKVLRREGLEVEEDTSYLAVVEGLLHLAWMEVVVEVQLWELLKVVEEERLFLWPEGEEGLNYVEGGEVEEALPSMVEEVVVLK